MFVCKATLEYNVGEKIARLTPEDYDALRKAVTSAHKKNLPVNFSEFVPKSFHGWSDTIMDDEEVEAFTRAGFEVQVKSIRGLSRGHGEPVVQHVTQISLANIGLLEINEVEVLENECTDALQQYLDKGWRILCVCPPKDSRRPDYIVGRRK
jgi:hypothetical protein